MTGGVDPDQGGQDIIEQCRFGERSGENQNKNKCQKTSHVSILSRILKAVLTSLLATARSCGLWNTGHDRNSKQYTKNIDGNTVVNFVVINRIISARLVFTHVPHIKLK